MLEASIEAPADESKQPEPEVIPEKAAKVPEPEPTPKFIQIAKLAPTVSKSNQNTDDIELKAVCKICGARMKSNAALGGHTSKAHPNESTTFQRKMKRREERALDREMLSAAKEVFTKLNPEKDISSSRSRIAFYKSKIRQNLSEETAEAIKAAQQEIYLKYRKPEVKKANKRPRLSS